jgi:threonine dehydratase
MVDSDDVERAAERIAGYVRRTPVIEVAAGDLAAVPLVLKLENMQRSGSFKARGAFNVLLRTRPDRVVTASGGNHGLAVATAAAALGIPAEVYVPTTTPAAKLDGLRAAGAEVRLVGSVYPEAADAAKAYAERVGLPYLHAFDDPEVVAGQGTTALELLADAPDVDTVLVAVGGGSLIGGTLAATDGRVVAVGAEPHGCPTMHTALAAGEPVDVDVHGLGVDALGAQRMGRAAFELIAKAGATSVLVDDAAITEARALLWTSLRLAVEPAAAVALAALRSGAYRPHPDARLAVIVCGGNVTP